MAIEKSEMELLAEISEKLDLLTMVTAVAGVEDREEHPDILIALGLDAKAIAKFTGLTPDAVRFRKARAGKKSAVKPSENGKAR
jgi:hypothetical protein